MEREDPEAPLDGEMEPYQQSMEVIFEVILLSVVGFFGILGNTMAIYVFSRQDTQLKFHRLMQMLAAFDLCYILFSLLLFTLPQVHPAYSQSGMHFWVLPRALPLAQISLTGSIYSTLAITVERYITVCHPFFAVSHKWTARRYIIPIVSFSVLYNVPKFFDLYTGVKENPLYNATSDTSVPQYNYTIEPTALRVNQIYIKVYCIWMNFVFMGFGPFCLLISLNALTLRSLLRAVSSSSSDLPQPRKKVEVALAKVSLSIVIVFILCHSVKWIPNLYELSRLTTKDAREWPPWVESVTHISHFLMTFNSSVNFYIYCAKHQRFARALLSGRGAAALRGPDVESTTAATEHQRLSLTAGKRLSSAMAALQNEKETTAAVPLIEHRNGTTSVCMTTSYQQ